MFGALALALLLIGSPAKAGNAGPTPYDACFSSVGSYYGINPLLLKAIARQESSMNPKAVGQNTNGTRDLGLMQINTTHLKKLAASGITAGHLMDACTNIAVGGWILADAVRRFGMSWKAVGVYHSPTPWRQQGYAVKVSKHLMREIAAANGRVPTAPPKVKAQERATKAQPDAATPISGSVVWEAASP